MASIIIISFHTVAEVYDCASILKQYHYNIKIPEAVLLPSILPVMQNVLPAYPEGEEIVDEDQQVELHLSRILERLTLLKSSEIECAISRIQSDPNYSNFLSKVGESLMKIRK